ncbi:MAG: DUF4271 domain-containing protein [Prevotella sp.]|jgi:hypothetical protein|nr:DUF4271 domain-containing protein [Prevotella sp.]
MKDTILYINSIIAADSLVVQDSLPQQNFSPFGGEMAKTLTAYTGKDSSPDASRHDGSKLPFSMENTDGISVLLLFCFIFFAHIYNGGISFLKENLSLLFQSEREKRMHKQTTVKEILYGYFLVFQAIVLVAVCVYDVFVEYDPAYAVHTPFLTVITLILVIGLFLGAKDFIYKIIGYIFDQQKLMITWRRVSVVGIEILGILYFIPTLLLIYSDYYHTEILALMLLMFLVVQMTLFYQIIFFFVNQKFNFLYLIAYLCTFEILPYIFLSTGLIYLYRTDIFNILWL